MTEKEIIEQLRGKGYDELTEEEKDILEVKRKEFHDFVYANEKQTLWHYAGRVANHYDMMCEYLEARTTHKRPENPIVVDGYTAEDLAMAPEGANLGLGCGNPHRKANIQPNEIVLDLGSGSGLDCFIAGKVVGRRGRVIGVDMTPEMLSRARTIAKENKIRNVEFRLGEIENLPIADNTADVCISNCVINMSSNKARVYKEIYRALKPGGRISLCDIVIMKELTEEMKNDEAMHSC